MSVKNKLIEATRQLLWEKGYDATSPRDILKRANVGQGALYHHFDGKLDLAVAAMEATVEEMIAECDQIFAADKPPMGRVWDYLTHPRMPLKGSRIGGIVMQGEIGESPLKKPVERYFRHLRGRLTEALDEAGREKGGRLSIPASDLATMLVATVQGGYILARALGDEEGMESAIRGALALLDRAGQSHER